MNVNINNMKKVGEMMELKIYKKPEQDDAMRLNLTQEDGDVYLEVVDAEGNNLYDLLYIDKETNKLCLCSIDSDIKTPLEIDKQGFLKVDKG